MRPAPRMPTEAGRSTRSLRSGSDSVSCAPSTVFRKTTSPAGQAYTPRRSGGSSTASANRALWSILNLARGLKVAPGELLNTLPGAENWHDIGPQGRRRGVMAERAALVAFGWAVPEVREQQGLSVEASRRGGHRPPASSKRSKPGTWTPATAACCIYPKRSASPRPRCCCVSRSSTPARGMRGRGSPPGAR